MTQDIIVTAIAAVGAFLVAWPLLRGLADGMRETGEGGEKK